jgi:hypothetical protein
VLVRIFLAGASGVIGQQLIPLLVAQGHDVVGMTRSFDKQDELRGLGAVPLVCDVFDTSSLMKAFTDSRPEVVIDQLTDLPDDTSRIAEFGERNSRLRREGTKNLLAAAQSVSTARFLIQSVAWQLPGDGGSAVAEMERSVLEARGLVIRYGSFYGPGTYYENTIPEHPRIHITEAARRTLPAIDSASGILFITEGDDAPSPNIYLID